MYAPEMNEFVFVATAVKMNYSENLVELTTGHTLDCANSYIMK